MVFSTEIFDFQPTPLTDYCKPITDFELKCCFTRSIFV